MKKLILVTSGEPSGVGPDICLDLVNFVADGYIIVVFGDVLLLQHRATILNKDIDFVTCTKENIANIINGAITITKGQLLVYHVDCPFHQCIGVLEQRNAHYVLKMLDLAVDFCQAGLSNILITAPISKENINRALGTTDFTGHTEYLAKRCGVDHVVMMLANQFMKVALLTTHVPLKDVASLITAERLTIALKTIFNTFKRQYNLANPTIAICGLNPHAGEGGYLGSEEVDVINPVIAQWQRQGYHVEGSFPADTIFLHANSYDVILAMYHDQGLPVLKYSGFSTGINVTLGLPIMRVSVDHGTALAIAGSGRANSESLQCALQFAITHDHRTI